MIGNESVKGFLGQNKLERGIVLVFACIGVFSAGLYATTAIPGG